MYAANDVGIGQPYPFGKVKTSIFPSLGCALSAGHLLQPRFERIIHTLRCPIHHISAFTSHSRSAFKFVWETVANVALFNNDAFDLNSWYDNIQDNIREPEDVASLQSIGLHTVARAGTGNLFDAHLISGSIKLSSKIGRGGGGGNPFAAQHAAKRASRSSLLRDGKIQNVEKDNERLNESQNRRLQSDTSSTWHIEKSNFSKLMPDESCLPEHRSKSDLLRDVYVILNRTHKSVLMMWMNVETDVSHTFGCLSK